MEYWSIGMMDSIRTPILHHSITPIFEEVFLWLHFAMLRFWLKIRPGS